MNFTSKNFLTYLNFRNLAFNITNRTWHVVEQLKLIMDAIKRISAQVDDVRNLSYSRKSDNRASISIQC